MLRPLTTLAFMGAALLAAGAAQAQDHRYYDNSHKDYHQWSPDEDREYHRFLQENHRKEHDWNKASKREQADYWKWRHDHMEHH